MQTFMQDWLPKNSPSVYFIDFCQIILSQPKGVLLFSAIYFPEVTETDKPYVLNSILKTSCILRILYLDRSNLLYFICIQGYWYIYLTYVIPSKKISISKLLMLNANLWFLMTEQDHLTYICSTHVYMERKWTKT